MLVSSLKSAAVIHAAMQEFQLKGFKTASMDDIAEAIHSPDLIKDAMDNFSKQESPLASWFNAAAAAGVLRTEHPDIVARQFTAVQMILKQYTVVA